MNHLKSFFIDIFKISNGYVPLWPIKANVSLGDLFLIRNGQLVSIGNIFDPYLGIYQDVDIDTEWHPTGYSWDIQSGLNYSVKTLSKEKKELQFKFNFKGAYFFQAPDVRCRGIKNFQHIKFKLLQQLASERFNFTEIYLISSIAKAPTFASTVASNSKSSAIISIPDNAKLPYSLSSLTKENFEWNLESMKGVSPFEIAHGEQELFFKAMKLETSPIGKEMVRKYITENISESFVKNMSNILNFAPSEILPSVDIFPAKVHDIFHFREMNLSDVLTLLE